MNQNNYYNRVQNSPGILDKSFTMKTLKLVLRASKIVNFYGGILSLHQDIEKSGTIDMNHNAS